VSGPPVTPRRSRRRLAALLVAAFAASFAGGYLIADEGSPPDVPTPPAPEGRSVSEPDVAGFDPFRYGPKRDREFLERGRDGNAHVVYAKSPGGVEATARRVARYDRAIRAAASRRGVDGSTLRALVFLESAGRPEVMAGGDPRGATGIAQILPGTARDLLGMRVDVDASRDLTRRIARYDQDAVLAPRARWRRIARRRAARLRARRRRVDERFDVERSLDAAARYLQTAKRGFGRDDFGLAAYHMGIANLRRVVNRYVSPKPRERTPRATIARYGLSYVQVYFDSTPVRNPRTHRLLQSFGDDSATYLFRVEAAREILRLYREDLAELRGLAAQHGAKASAEEVLRPRTDNPPFEDTDALRDAYDDGDLVALPDDPRLLAFSVDRRMGSLARRLRASPVLYRGVRRDALATLLFIAKETRRAAGRGAIRVTSTVRDLGYQRLLIRSNPQATSGFSLHTTGYAIDLARDPRRRWQERALVPVLTRLRSLGVIDWVYEPTAIHLTVGPEGRRFRPLLDALLED
jgi:soluble lytic murein transglycosylase-like protein